MPSRKTELSKPAQKQKINVIFGVVNKKFTCKVDKRKPSKHKNLQNKGGREFATSKENGFRKMAYEFFMTHSYYPTRKL